MRKGDPQKQTNRGASKKSKRNGREREQTTSTDTPVKTQNVMHNMPRKNTATSKNNATKTRNAE